VAQTVLALEAAASMILANDPALADILRNARACADSYGLDAQAAAARQIWEGLLARTE